MNLINFALRRIRAKNSPLVLYMHGLGNPSHTKNLYKNYDLEEFKRVMSKLLINLNPLEDLSKESICSANGNKFILTIDDGLASISDGLVQYLEKKGIPAIFFVTKNFLCQNQIFYRFKASLIIENIKKHNEEIVTNMLNSSGYFNNDLRQNILAVKYYDSYLYDEILSLLKFDINDYFKKNKPYMDIDSLKKIVNRGFYVGSHSVNHPKYNEITINEMMEETIDGVNAVQNIFNLNYRYFAFPFSDKGVPQEFYKNIKDSVDLIFTTNGWRSAQNNFVINRASFEIMGGW